MAEATAANCISKRKRIQMVIDSMLKRQKTAKIVGHCYMHTCDLYDAIKLNNLGDPEFVAGWAANKMSSKSEAKTCIMKQEELKGPGQHFKKIIETRPVWTIGSHCWIELDGEILDPSYEWNGIGMKYYSNFNIVMKEYGEEMTMEQKMFILQRTNSFINAWKGSLPERTPQKFRDFRLKLVPNYDELSQKEKNNLLLHA